MRYNSFLIILLFCGANLLAQPEIPLSSEISAVTVYQSGAQITRQANLRLNAGRSKLVFRQLSREVNSQSITLAGQGDFSILSISHRNNYLEKDQVSAELRSLQDSIKEAERAINRLQAQANGLENEKQLILANRDIGGSNGIVSLEQLQGVARFTGKRTTEINLALLEIAAEKEKLEKRRQKLQQQLNQDQARLRDRPGEVVVEVEANAAQSVSLNLSYLINSAGWQSAYDARVNSLDQPLELTHKARIYQQSGEDWQGVDLTLSTANPSVGGQVPYLGPWYVGFRQNTPRPMADNNRMRLKNADVAMESLDEVVLVNGVRGQEFQMEQNITQQEYSVERKQSIPSSAQPTTVQLRQLSLPAHYEYHIKPSLDPDAFLIALLHGWEQYDLLAGELSLYNRDTYVGKSYLNPQLAQDSLQLSMGRDKGIVVNRERVVNKQERSFLGGKQIDQFGWRIELRNNKASAVEILLKEPIPLSRDEDIEVELEEKSGAELAERAGILRWRFELAPGQSKTLEVRYEVSYPKERQIQYGF